MAASASETLEALGANTHFSLEPILVNIEVGQYVGPSLPGTMANLLAGLRPSGGGGGGGGGSSGDGGGSGGTGKSVGNGGGGGVSALK